MAHALLLMLADPAEAAQDHPVECLQAMWEHGTAGDACHPSAVHFAVALLHTHAISQHVTASANAKAQAQGVQVGWPQGQQPHASTAEWEISHVVGNRQIRLLNPQPQPLAQIPACCIYQADDIIDSSSMHLAPPDQLHKAGNAHDFRACGLDSPCCIARDSSHPSEEADGSE